VITLTRRNGSELVINAAMIEVVEATPDTVITLISGRKYVVAEAALEVVQSVTEYYRSIGLVASQGSHERGVREHES